MLLEYIKKIKDVISIKEWLDDLRYAKRDGLRSTAKRVMSVLNAHEIPVTRIPQIFPEFGFKFSDFNTLDLIINILKPEFLERLSEHFFINREWLDTGRGEIQSPYERGYDLESLYNLIATNYQDNDTTTIIAHFVVEDDVKFVPVADHGTFENLMIILEHKTKLSDKEEFEYSRYQPLYFGYWHYYKTRMIIKSLSLLFFQSQSVITQKGYFIKQLKEDGLQKQFAVRILNNILRGSWHPDDYIFCNGKSAQEKDPADAREMHEYLKRENLYDDIKNLRTSKFLD
jgi:hypothetical protein